jgi:hypothetical protein
MRVNRTTHLRKSAAECTALAQKTCDPRARAVLATAAIVWEKLAEQQGYRVAPQLSDLIDLLDAAVIADRATR